MANKNKLSKKKLEKLIETLSNMLEWNITKNDPQLKKTFEDRLSGLTELKGWRDAAENLSKAKAGSEEWEAALYQLINFTKDYDEEKG